MTPPPESKPAALTPAQLLKDTEGRMVKAIEVVAREFSTVRTGRASAALVEGIRVEYYGTPTPLKQLAQISVPDPRLVVIQPWDPKVLPEIERAIQKSDLGLSPLNDGKVIRLSVPSLSTERREELAKLVHKLAEEGRVAVRNVRHTAKEAIEKLFKEKVIAEDDKFKNLDSLEKLTHKYQARIEEILASKESDLKTV
ncbi:MAG: ribosome recycling factor [Candidatus Omnitrophica bacterium]|nr:ribosome recycling factor [Candidatus Omnitrophota bacterium]